MLGGLPLNASWAPDLCTCVGSCKFSVRVQQSQAGANSSALEPTPPSIATSFSTTLISLVDNSTLVVQVQCVDAFGRSSRWISSQGTVVVLARSINVVCGSLRLNGGIQNTSTVRGLIGAFQSSAAPPMCSVMISPPTATAVTVAVSRLAASSNAASAIEAGAQKFRNGTLVSVSDYLIGNERTLFGQPLSMPVTFPPPLQTNCSALCAQENADGSVGVVCKDGSATSACSFSSSCSAACYGWNVTTQCQSVLSAVAMDDSQCAVRSPGFNTSAAQVLLVRAFLVCPIVLVKMWQ
jgi:hypothetical protein